MLPDALRVVYAEDDPLVRETVCAMLRELGAEVHPCKNGAEAVLLCLSVNPDVALLDLSMLGMNGFDGATRIRDNETVSGKRVRLVALTGRSPEYAVQARQAGFDEFLSKPVTLERLAAAVDEWRSVTASPRSERSASVRP
ncbi:MAG TPA: response regulator [Rhodanobacteraceae bacterium]|nr:response regulator [Rhodanobacteraceae bacterium]